jgi:predicted nuclease of predicted toxin-antitoxin system
MSTRLLFDHNLSIRLVTRLEDVFQDTNHVFLAGLSQALDTEIWQFARENHYAIVTKDSDFSDLGVLLGTPPKVIWLRIGNASVYECEQYLREYASVIVDFLSIPETRLLTITRH